MVNELRGCSMRTLITLTKTIVAAIGALLAVTVSAAALSFNFSFTNVANGGGMVTGVIRGLTDNSFSQASSFEITGNSDGFSIGEYVGNPQDNIFEVSNGQIVFADFRAFGIDNTPPAVTDSSFRLCIGCNVIIPSLTAIGLTNEPLFVESSSTSAAGLTISTVPVPLPAAFPLAFAGFAALIAIKRRRRLS